MKTRAERPGAIHAQVEYSGELKKMSLAAVLLLLVTRLQFFSNLECGTFLLWETIEIKLVSPFPIRLIAPCAVVKVNV